MKKISVKKAIIILSTVALVGVGIIYTMASKNKSSLEYTTQQIVKTNLVQTVSETGVIKTSKSFDLSFEQSGKINKLHVVVGQLVEPGQLIAELDYASLDIKLSQTRASLDIARANLSKLQRGATKEELAIYQANYERARAAYESAVLELNKFKISLNENISQTQKTLDDLEDGGSSTITTYEQAVDSALTNLNNAKIVYQKDIDNTVNTSITNAEAQSSSITNSLDQINSIISDNDIEDFLSVKNRTYLTESRRAYDEAKILLSDVNKNLLLIKNSPNKDNAKEHLSRVLTTLNKTYFSLNNTFSALENSVTSSSFTKTQVDSLKAIINTQIGIISSGIASIQSSSQSLDNSILVYNTKVDAANDSLTQARASLDNATISAKNNLINTKNNGEQQITALESKIDASNKSLLVSLAEFNKIKSPARIEDVNLYQAQLKQAESEVESINNQIEKSKLKSPVIGTISKLNFEPGEQYSIGKPVTTIISDGQYEIEVDISESDITKVKINDKAVITLDAFTNDLKLYGTVSFIEPAETVIQEVIYYKVKVIFDSNNGNISLVKPGMTADVEITTDEKTNIIAVPGRSVIDKNGDGKFVRTYNNNVLEEKKVEVGIIGDGGLVEILSGIVEGDKVITSTKEK